MRRLRHLALLAACGLGLIGGRPARGDSSAAADARTSAYVAGFQNADGGFAGKPGGQSSLGATSSAVRTLKNTGGSIPDVLGCLEYVRLCFDPASGGFAPTPGGTPDVGTTATGLMAAAELRVTTPAMSAGAVRYLGANAKTFDEVRIAVAGLEATHTASPDFPRWTAQVLDGRNADGTFGSGPSQAFETGGKAVALLRMGAPLDKGDEVIAFLKSAQRPDGGWAKDDSGSDLEATYRILRGLFMRQAVPDLDRLAGFVAACRHDDGSYGQRPGAEGGPGGTYYATTVMRWARLLGGEPALVETAGFRPLLNGKDLEGWEGDTALWSARDGVLVGRSPGLAYNDFLVNTVGSSSFVLKLTFRLDRGAGNSGVQFRSRRVEGHEVAGYQADIGDGFWGTLYDEARRNKALATPRPEALKSLRREGWNSYSVDAKNAHIRLYLNGSQTVDYRETDPAIAPAGHFAFQIHAGGPMVINYKDVLIQDLPEPKPDPSATFGFHLRTLGDKPDGRKYAVSLPPHYNAETVFPVVLFLHGSGERGDDGMQPAQVGLGPALYNAPTRCPAIVVYPQARQTWAAGSEDAKAALAALDEVLTAYKCDRNRVALTGISMGGRGAWEIAAAEPGRFSAVAPVCGMGSTDSAKTLAKLPVWAVVGDADRDATVLNARAMTLAVREAGGKPKLTEYRGVGHNSWDRAYQTPALIDWMLAQARP